MDGPPRQPRLGNLTVTKPVPNFLRQFQAPPESSIEEAIRRRAEEKREEEVPRTLSAFGRSDRLVKPSCMVS